MIYAIYGEDTALSRKKLSELTESATNVIRIDGKKQSLSDIEMALYSDALFDAKKTVVIDFFSKVKPFDKFLEKVLALAKDSSTTVILWDEIELPAKILNSLKSMRSFSFSFPKFYYAFLDGLVPKSAHSVNLYHEVLKTFEPEQVLFGLIRRIRQLMLVKSNESRHTEMKSMQGWQLGKLKKQADAWTERELEEKFLALADLDEKMKTSALTLPVSAHLDIILLQD